MAEMCCSQKNRVLTNHITIAFNALVLLLLLMLVTFDPGCCLRYDGDEQTSSCDVPRQLGCFCRHDHEGRHRIRTYIKCDEVQLTEVPRNFSSPNSLRMSRTQLQLNDPVPYHHSLTDLRIESNAIPYIRDGAFEQLENLITLILSNNGIRILTGRTFAGLRSLEFLSLEGNSIVNIKAEVFSGLNMPNLKILKMSNCGISSVHPHSFSGLHQLSLLDLSSNNIEELPVVGDRSRLPSLTSLELSNNRLRDIDRSTFHNLPFVRHLFVSHNRISILLRNSFTRSMQKTLLSLHLRYNDLAVVETLAIGQLESLTTLDISYNNLRTLGSDDIPDNVDKILIHDNPWTCGNCENDWILENPNVRNWNQESSVTCSWPHKGQNFFNSSLPSKCDDGSQTITAVSNDVKPRFNGVLWITTASVLVSVISISSAAIYIYIRCIKCRRRCRQSTSKAPRITMETAGSKQWLVVDDSA